MIPENVNGINCLLDFTSQIFMSIYLLLNYKSVPLKDKITIFLLNND